jgi:hypothetical protein
MVTASTTGLVAALLMASSASADSAGTATAQTPAVVGPLLDLFSFGDNIGLPLACGTGAAAIGSGAAEYGLAAQASTLVNAINSSCATASSYGAQFIAAGQSSDAPLSSLNTLLNPLLANTGSSLTEFGTTYGSALNPLGPSIAATGGTVEWFEGS